MLVVLALVGAAVQAHAQTYTDLFNLQNGTPSYPSILAQGRDGNLYGTTPSGGTGNKGIVFKITPGGVQNVLFNFDAVHGDYTTSGLTLGTDGNFYGAAHGGGANNLGTIFKITSSGTPTTLYSFANNGTDGFYPWAPPIQGADGNFYGISGAGNAYKITASGTFTPLGKIGSRSVAPLVLGTDGNLYGTNDDDGSGSGLVFKIANGAISTVYTFDLTHGAGPYDGLMQASDGNFYGTASGGGSKNGGVVFKLTPRGTITVLHNFDPSGSLDGYGPTAGMLQASDGNFYGVTVSGGNVGTGYGVIFKVTPAGKYSVLYNFDSTHGAYPYVTPLQHTNGKIYGLTFAGGTGDGTGVVYSYDLGLPPFVRTVTNFGKVGKTVEILGQGFAGTTGVTFNGKTAKFAIVSDTYLTATIPAGATTGLVKVVTPGGTLTSNQKFRVTPQIASFAPPSGPVTTSVTITGVSLTGATKVTFGGVAATSFTVDSDTLLTAAVPAGAKTGKIALTTPGGNAASATNFTVTP